MNWKSIVFGEIRDETSAEKKILEKMADECPQALFGALNKRLNERGLCLLITETNKTN